MKLTKEELSRILGLADIGTLNYYGDCIAVVALALKSMPLSEDCSEYVRAWRLSRRVAEGDIDFGGSPDNVLRFLESKGLA